MCVDWRGGNCLGHLRLEWAVDKGFLAIYEEIFMARAGD